MPFHCSCKVRKKCRECVLAEAAALTAAMTLFLRSAVNVFKAFDSQGSGRVNMDFSQFIYAASHCR